MSIASRAGKLPLGAAGNSERWRCLEDLLTADVFGALRYLPSEVGLLPILAMARSLDDVTLPAWLATRDVEWISVRDATIQFWPRLENGEPDLLVTLLDATHVAVAAVLIEVKLHSPQHEIDGMTQLAAYGRSFLTGPVEPEPDPPLPDRRVVVLLTKHDTVPKGPMQDVVNGLRAPRAERKVEAFWLSWHHVRQALAEAGTQDPAVQRLLLDVLEDLAERGFVAPRPRLHFPLPDLLPLSAELSELLRPRRRQRVASMLPDLPVLPDVTGFLSHWRLR